MINIKYFPVLLRNPYGRPRDFCPRFTKLFQNNMRTMNCSCRNNRNVDIGGVRKKIYGLMNRLEVSDPDQVDLQNMKNVIKLFHVETQNLKTIIVL